jgi:hypothetical protein
MAELRLAEKDRIEGNTIASQPRTCLHCEVPRLFYFLGKGECSMTHKLIGVNELAEALSRAHFMGLFQNPYQRVMARFPTFDVRQICPLRY